jgi:Transposase DDE domain
VTIHYQEQQGDCASGAAPPSLGSIEDLERARRSPRARHLLELVAEIVKRSDQTEGFEVLPMRWVIERSLAWFNRCRRLAKDFENITDNALAFLRLASIRLMLRRLCNPS